MTRHPESEELTTIRDRFSGAWRQLGARDLPDLAEILARYGEPHRAYHTLEHVLACLRWLDTSRELAGRPAEAELALIYHDVVYDPGRTDNEQRSAELFRLHAQTGRLAAPATERIASLIVSTADHAAGDGDAALVNDIDLAVLGASPHRYDRYEKQIRDEYRRVNDRLFRVGRERVLRSFLEATEIYRTAFFRERLETQARTNLSRALLALRS